MKGVKFIGCLLLLSMTGMHTPVQIDDRNGKYGVRTVVIDPGHGGRDSGCQGTFTKEKHVVLAIALKLGEYIEKNFPEIKVVYTRKTDEFIPLHKRTEIANKHKADLFISIHCNAAPATAAYGTETYVMGLHRTKHNLDVAMRENAVILLEEDYEQHYDGFDPKSPHGYIIFSLNQNAFLDQSISLASKIERQFSETAKRHSRGVKQAGFLVLYRTAMPSVLVEVGFLSNREEEKFLANPAGKEKIAMAIYNAFVEYKNDIDERIAIVRKPLALPPKANGEIQQQVVLKIQLAASYRSLDLSAPPYSGVRGIEVERDGSGLIRYLYGSFTDLSTAVAARKELQQKGFRDAFIVAYQEGTRITLEEAKKLLK